MFKRKFLRCSSLVDPNAVKRESIDGIEHIIVSSFTLPSDIVMNGVMYPAEEIDNSFEGLNRTLAPIEHPKNSSGDFLSANDPEAIHNYHAGAFNDNARKVGNRIQVDKVINVQEAAKTERGKRLLDRINELETSKDPRPIHTSTGIFLEIEELSEPTTNAAGQEYQMIARNMVFDHDAILLDSVGAAKPHQGVGMAVNDSGEKFPVEFIELDKLETNAACAALRNAAARLGQTQGPSEAEKEEICGIINAYLNRLENNQSGLPVFKIMNQLSEQAKKSIIHEWLYVADLFDNMFIIETNDGYFEAPYRVDDNIAHMEGIPVPVDRVISYQPKMNAQKGDVMRDMIINALEAVGKYNDGMTDKDLLKAYNELMIANQADDGEDGDENGGDVDAIANALKPLQDQIADLKKEITANSDAKKSDLIKTIVNSKKYPDLDESDLGKIDESKLSKMAANCGIGHGLPFHANEGDDGQSGFATAPTEMPK